MEQEKKREIRGISRQAEEDNLKKTLAVVHDNVEDYRRQVAKMKEDIDEMLEHYHDDNVELFTVLSNTTTMHDHMKRALERNEKARSKPYFGRIVYKDISLNKEESVYIGKGGIARDSTHLVVVDWRAPVANAYYENGLGRCSYPAPGDVQIEIDLRLKRTYEIEEGKLLDYYDTELVANDELLTKYLAKNKQAVLGEIIATIQKEQNEIIRKSPYHNIIVQGVAGSGKTTVAMHRISYILYNYQERFQPVDFYIVGSNRILLDYITGVLPDLDVYGIRQMTMEQLFVRLLYEDFDEKRHRIKDAGRMTEKDSIKGTLEWFCDLKEYCSKLEREMIQSKSVYLNPRQFVEGIRDGKTGVHDETEGETDPGDLIELLSGEAIERYVSQNPAVSIQSKINMLNTRLLGKVRDEFLRQRTGYTENERKAILKAYRGRFGGRVFKRTVFDLYREFLTKQLEKGYNVTIPEEEFDVYDLAALAYLYKRVKETDVISEAHHIVIDEAQDFGMMAYSVLKFCIRDCTYTVMGDISQNIRFGYGMNDWEELKDLLLTDEKDSFCVLEKSYRNTVEIAEFASGILDHGTFCVYPAKPVIRHGDPVRIAEVCGRSELMKKAAAVCREWQEKGLDTVAVICRNRESAELTAKEMGSYVKVLESDLERAVFGSGVMVLPVEYTKGLEFDAVLILDPDRQEYPVDDGHAKLLYVAATRALHELCVLHTGNLTGLIADPVLKRKIREQDIDTEKDKIMQKRADEQGRSETGETFARKKIVIARSRTANTTSVHKTGTKEIIPAVKSREREVQKKAAGNTDKISFGDMPATEKLRPAGHARADLAVKWVTKQPDGIYLHSRFGVLRLSPVGSAIVRVSFAKGQQIIEGTNDKIAVCRTDNRWMYKEAAGNVELLTDELCLRVNKETGAVQYLTRDKKILLSERERESRQIETGTNGSSRIWLFTKWQKGENVYGMSVGGKNGINLRGSARYISHESSAGELPFLLSDKGYGILIAANSPVFCCDVPAYGTYICMESEAQLDYYFIAGKRQNTILNACAYLCGKL